LPSIHFHPAWRPARGAWQSAVHFPIPIGLKEGRISGNLRINFHVPIEFRLNQMTVSEKVRSMETLWGDLSRKPDEIESPAWHKEALDECRRRADAGEEQFTDWAAAKDEIRRRVS
jgi:hypothetical protein